MGIFSWLKSLKTEKETIINDMETIPILRTETPQKIIETRIKPVKIPTIVDLTDRLGLITRHLIELRDETTTKSWFKSEYEDTGTEVAGRLANIEISLNNIHDNLAKITKVLSNFTESITKPELSKVETRSVFGVSNQILAILKRGEKMRYKDLFSELGVSDPTLSKYLKTLCEDNKIKREKMGKAVYYQLFSSDSNSS